MSAPRLGQTGDPGPNLLWSALFVAASLVGGLAAAELTHLHAWIAVLFSLLVALVMVILLYMGLLDDTRSGSRGAQGGEAPAGSRGGTPAGGQHRYPGPVGSPSGPPPSVPEAAAKPVEPGLAMLMQPEPGSQARGGDGWWAGHMEARPRERSASRPGPQRVDLAQFLDQALIAQCPRCGAFRIDADNRATEWLFRCKECSQGWTWQPGTPWPAVQVRPEARGRTNRP